MVKSQNQKLQAALAIMVMLAASPLTVTFVYAENEDLENSIDSAIRNHLETILTEKVIDGKLKVQQISVPKDATTEEIRKILNFNGEARSWAYVKGFVYNSGIVLFDGREIKFDDDNWKTNSKETLEVSGNQGFKHEGGIHDIFDEDALNEHLKYRIVFSGNVSISSEDALSIAIHTGYKNPGTETIAKSILLGKLLSDPVEEGQSSANSLKKTVMAAHSPVFFFI